MNWIDILLITIIMLAVFGGLYRGFVLGSLGLIGWIISVCAGFACYPYVAKLFEQYVPSVGIWTLPLSFILVIIMARLILSVIINSILRSTSSSVHRSALNHVAGMIPGFINGMIYAAITTALLLAFPISNEFSDTARSSIVANKFGMQVEWLNDKI